MSAASWSGFSAGTGGVLLLRTSTEDERVALAEGSGRWRDFVVRTRVRVAHGAVGRVLVRTASEGDYMACVLAPARATLERASAGVVTTIAVAPLPSAEGRALDVVIRVHGSHMSLAVDGVPTLSEDVVAAPRQGGVGFSVSRVPGGVGLLEVSFVAIEPYAPGPEVPLASPATRERRQDSASGE